MTEEKMQMVITHILMILLGIICLLVHFFALELLGVSYEKLPDLILFLILYIGISLTISVMIENSVLTYRNAWHRQLMRTILILVIDFIILIGLTMSIPEIILPSESIILFTVFTYLSETYIMRWLNKSNDANETHT
ncbi:MAG: hypothetical protein ACRDAO_08080 [Culicoidibacterales bacterium]